MSLPQYATEVEEILKIAREKALELGQESVSSEFLLYAIIKHENNNGVQLLNSRKVALTKLRGLVTDRLEAIRRVPISNSVLPRISNQLRHILSFANVIASGVIDAASLVHALYRARDSASSQLLISGGFTEPGEKERPSSEGNFRRSSTPNLNQFSTDLTYLAMMGKLDPVIGRTNEIDRMVEVLARRKKNNPVLIGEPGVGKTSVVEGLALKIVAGSVPEVLQNKRILSLDLNSVVAGTQYRGQFEKRMQLILHELSQSKEVIVFIDELHTLMGTGGTEGTGDSSSIIKPALSRGTIRCIGATTLSEYRKHIEKDGALERRFQRIMVEAPTLAEVKEIIEQVKPLYETFHGVTYTPEAAEAVVTLTNRYISDRNFPDKAIDVLDETGSIAYLANKKVVTELEVQENIARMTGIPAATLGKTERERLKSIEQDLSLKVIGQEDGIKELAYAIKRSRTGIKSEKRPSSFLFLGPTGVGKTETAKQLAKYLFDREESLIRIDMSEFSERHTVSTLIGAPPGFVGYDEGGKLTEAIRRHPYSIVLFDEIEKAHSDVFNILLQVFDDGVLTDAAGRKVNFKNTILILTSNIGATVSNKSELGFTNSTQADVTKANFQRSLKEFFRPEFINRLDAIVVYKPLTKEHIKKIMDLYVEEMNSKFKIKFTDEAKEYFSKEGYSIEFGARPLRRLIEQEVETKMADILLDKPDAKEFNVNYVDNKVVVSV